MITSNYITDTYRGYQLRINRNGEVSIFSIHWNQKGEWEFICDELDRAAAEATIDRWLNAR